MVVSFWDSFHLKLEHCSMRRCVEENNNNLRWDWAVFGFHLQTQHNSLASSPNLFLSSCAYCTAHKCSHVPHIIFHCLLFFRIFTWPAIGALTVVRKYSLETNKYLINNLYPSCSISGTNYPQMSCVPSLLCSKGRRSKSSLSM